jgi:hypothetical protein
MSTHYALGLNRVRTALGRHFTTNRHAHSFPALGAKRVSALLTALLLLCACAASTFAQDASELAKQVQNPIASLISLPFQNNFNFGVGSKSDSQYVQNIQPVIPFSLTSDWNLITRTIIPLVRQPQLAPGLPDDTFGLSDTELSLFVSPAKPGPVIWGIGPVFGLPTATNDVLGTRKFSVGPSFVALTNRGHWVLGALVNDLISVAGQARRRSVDQMLLQPFVNYNMRHGWYLTTSPFITADWMADNGNRWSVPIGGGAGRVFRIGKQAVNTQVQAFGNTVHPNGGGTWSLRFQVQLLFPRKPRG